MNKELNFEKIFAKLLMHFGLKVSRFLRVYYKRSLLFGFEMNSIAES